MQVSQFPPSINLPGAQVEHVVDPFPENLPLAHASHVVVRAFSVENVFSAHFLHKMDVSLLAYSPGIQGRLYPW